MAYVNPRTSLHVAIIVGKTGDMDRAANRVLQSVRRVAAQHVDTGNYIRNLRVDTVPGQSGTGRLVSDRLVSANDPGAMSIEYGHMYRVPGARRVRWVPGLHIMRKGLEGAG